MSTSSSISSSSFAGAPATSSSTMTIPEEDYNEEPSVASAAAAAGAQLIRKTREIELLQAEVKRLGELLSQKRITEQSSVKYNTVADITPSFVPASLFITGGPTVLDNGLPSPANSEDTEENENNNENGNTGAYVAELEVRRLAAEVDSLTTEKARLQLCVDTAMVALGTAGIPPPALLNDGTKTLDPTEFAHRIVVRIGTLERENEMLAVCIGIKIFKDCIN